MRNRPQHPNISGCGHLPRIDGTPGRDHPELIATNTSGASPTGRQPATGFAEKAQAGWSNCGPV